MDILTKTINYILDYINAVPASSWAALGTLLAGSAVVTGFVAWYNRNRLKRDLERLGRASVTFLVTVLSAVVTVLDFVLNNGSTFGHFLPYFATHMTQVIAISTVIYNVAKPTLQWFKDRQAGKAISNGNAPELAPLVEAVTAPVSPAPATSFGTEAAGIDRSNLLQL